jgi:hypothetical protein
MILNGLVLLVGGLLLRLSLFCQFEVRFGWRYSIPRVGFYRLVKVGGRSDESPGHIIMFTII